MKKIAFLIVALTLLAGSSASAAFVVKMTNSADGSDSIQALNLNYVKANQVSVYNNANVELNSNTLLNSGYAVAAGGDIETSEFSSGSIIDTETHMTSANDTVVLNGAADAAGGADLIDMYNNDDDTVQTVDAAVVETNALQTANNLNYVENFNDVANNGAIVAAADDIEDTKATTSTVNRNRGYTRMLQSTLIGNGVNATISL